MINRPTGYLVPLSVRDRISKPQPLGLPLINLGFNELPFGPTPAVAEAIKNWGKRANYYGNPSCTKLRNALGAHNEIDPETIICGNGSEELLDVIARNFVRPGDDLVISEFGYIQFVLTAHRLGANLVKAKEADFTTDVDSLLAAVTPQTKLMFVANPNNPTGTVLPVSEIIRLVDGLRADVVLVLDLAYGEFTGFDYCTAIHNLVLGRENVVITRTFSKAFGLAGLRVGWAHVPAWMLPGLYAARGMGSVNAVAQAAAVAGISDIDQVKKRVDNILYERDRVRQALQEMGIFCLQSAANFLLARIGKCGADMAEAMVVHLHDKAGIIVNRTRESGLEHYFRFCLSLPDHNDLLLDTARSLMIQVQD
ncbi:MAG: histidinol-phosphate transaminase [Rhodobacteraceae bacterium]|nr:histidinol-phosphate transaminase [Paracoccaceae bacterium]